MMKEIIERRKCGNVEESHRKMCESFAELCANSQLVVFSAVGKRKDGDGFIRINGTSGRGGVCDLMTALSFERIDVDNLIKMCDEESRDNPIESLK